jgi:murein DD-endopeptidase MepM/ murein hydrolase activator NlpD
MTEPCPHHDGSALGPASISRRRLIAGSAVGAGLFATWRLGAVSANAPNIGKSASAVDSAHRLGNPTFVDQTTSTIPLPEIDPPAEGEILFPLQLDGDEFVAYVIDNFGDTRGRCCGYYHQAVDIMAPENTPQLAAADGELTNWYEGGFHGWTLTGDDGVTYKYFHNTPDQNGWSVGDRVTRGDVIGFVGDTGTSPGNFHLHFEYRPNNVPADPFQILQRVPGATFG